jgi:hypothetical protein
MLRYYGMATKPKRPRDPNQLAHLIGQIATGEVKEESQPDTRNAAAVALGALWRDEGITCLQVADGNF